MSLGVQRAAATTSDSHSAPQTKMTGKLLGKFQWYVSAKHNNKTKNITANQKHSSMKSKWKGNIPVENHMLVTDWTYNICLSHEKRIALQSVM